MDDLEKPPRGGVPLLEPGAPGVTGRQRVESLSEHVRRLVQLGQVAAAREPQQQRVGQVGLVHRIGGVARHVRAQRGAPGQDRLVEQALVTLVHGQGQPRVAEIGEQPGKLGVIGRDELYRRLVQPLRLFQQRRVGIEPELLLQGVAEVGQRPRIGRVGRRPGDGGPADLDRLREMRRILVPLEGEPQQRAQRGERVDPARLGRRERGGRQPAGLDGELQDLRVAGLQVSGAYLVRGPPQVRRVHHQRRAVRVRAARLRAVRRRSLRACGGGRARRPGRRRHAVLGRARLVLLAAFDHGGEQLQRPALLRAGRRLGPLVPEAGLGRLPVSGQVHAQAEHGAGHAGLRRLPPVAGGALPVAAAFEDIAEVVERAGVAAFGGLPQQPLGLVQQALVLGHHAERVERVGRAALSGAPQAQPGPALLAE
jgi:hypothetical protein